MDNKDWSDSADVQADLSLHWAHTSESMFFHNAAHIEVLSTILCTVNSLSWSPRDAL